MEPSSAYSLAGAGLSLVGGLAANSGNSRQARINREHQVWMSSTAHRREVSDLIGAGLNPILSAGGGGASGTGAAQATINDPITPAVSAAMQQRRLQADIESLESLRDKTDSEKRGVDYENVGREFRAFIQQGLLNSAQAAEGKYKDVESMQEKRDYFREKLKNKPSEPWIHEGKHGDEGKHNTHNSAKAYSYGSRPSKPNSGFQKEKPPLSQYYDLIGTMP